MKGGEGGWRWLKIMLIFAVLVVIQMRLVWMQLREFRVQNSPRTEMSIDFLDQFRGVTCARGSALGLAPLSAPHLTKGAHSSGWTSGGIAAVTQSPGVTFLLERFFCDQDRVADQMWLKVNQWIFVSAVVLAALAARILARSWTLALFAAATLMTRGSLLTGIGDFGAANHIMLAFTAWFAATVHFMRSGSLVALAACGVSIVVGSIFDPAIAVVGLALPMFIGAAFVFRASLIRPLLQKVRLQMRGMRQRAAWARQFVLAAPVQQGATSDSFFWNSLTATRRFIGLEVPEGAEPISWRRRYERGSLFRPAEVPFLIWAMPERSGALRWRPLVLALGSLFIVVCSIGGLTLAAQWVGHLADLDAYSTFKGLWADGRFVEGVIERWYFEVFTVFDFHLLVSLGLTLWAATQSPAHGLTGYFEAVWVFIIAVFLLGVAALTLDVMDARLLNGAFPWLGSGQLFSHRPLLVWVQPVLLMMGVTSAFNMLKVIDSRLRRAH